MRPEPEPFAHTYAEARAKFLAAADGTRLESHPEPLRGMELEALAMDVARIGADDADALLIVSSGCHGVEGYCGSGAQVALLHDESFRAKARHAGVALLFIHALNPWGFSFGRRVTHEGVDLNRNFIDFRRPPPGNPGYDQLAAFAAARPMAAARRQRAPADGLRRRRTACAALQAAISGGQYTHPDGVFYGGAAPTWSQQTLRLVLRQHARACRQLGWIDLHSGLGESGVGERIFACRDDDAAKHRAKAWWGNRITFTEDGSSTSSDLHGNLWHAVYDECPQADYAGITLEFGTQPQAVGDRGAALRPLGGAPARSARRAAARRPRRDAPRVLHRHARVEAGRASRRRATPRRRRSTGWRPGDDVLKRPQAVAPRYCENAARGARFGHPLTGEPHADRLAHDRRPGILPATSVLVANRRRRVPEARQRPGRRRPGARHPDRARVPHRRPADARQPVRPRQRIRPPADRPGAVRGGADDREASPQRAGRHAAGASGWSRTASAA